MLKRTLFTLAVLAVAAGTAQAQSSCTGTSSCTITPHPTSVTIPSIVALDITAPGDGAGSTLLATQLTPPTATDLGGFVANQGPTFNVRANRSWTFQISAAAGAFSYSGSESGARAASTLAWSTTAGGTFTGMSTTAAPVTTGSRTAGTPVSLFYRLSYPADLSDPANAPGTYELPLTFTLTTP